MGLSGLRCFLNQFIALPHFGHRVAPDECIEQDNRIIIILARVVAVDSVVAQDNCIHGRFTFRVVPRPDGRGDCFLTMSDVGGLEFDQGIAGCGHVVNQTLGTLQCSGLD